MEEISDNLTGFLDGEKKPVIQFEFTYMNLVFMGVMIIAVVVISSVIVKAIK